MRCRATSLIAAMFSVLTASAQPAPAQARTHDGAPGLPSPDRTLRFEVVSVKLSAPGDDPLMHRQLRTVDPGRIHYVNAGLKDLVMDAYNLKPYQVVGPDWLGDIGVDIDATMRPGATKEQVRVMFQNLLADRFKLTFHWDTKDLPTYSIAIAGNGPKMKESTDPPPPGGDAPPPPVGGLLKLDSDGLPIFPALPRDGAGTVMINGRSEIRGQRATLQELADELSKTQLKYPVTDDTGLKAKYDFTLKFATPGWNGRLEDIPSLGISADAYQAMQPLPDLGPALQAQLGLKLQSKKAPVAVFVVDHVEKAPTAN
jgi:uncharacterized protein (TIGR03435 family)